MYYDIATVRRSTLSAQVPTPDNASAVSIKPVKPSKAKIAAHAFVKAIISPEARKLECALARYVAYAVLTAVGYKHAGSLGL